MLKASNMLLTVLFLTYHLRSGECAECYEEHRHLPGGSSPTLKVMPHGMPSFTLGYIPAVLDSRPPFFTVNPLPRICTSPPAASAASAITTPVGGVVSLPDRDYRDGEPSQAVLYVVQGETRTPIPLMVVEKIARNCDTTFYEASYPFPLKERLIMSEDGETAVLQGKDESKLFPQLPSLARRQADFGNPLTLIEGVPGVFPRTLYGKVFSYFTQCASF